MCAVTGCHTIAPTKQRLHKHTSVAAGTDLVWETRTKEDELEGKLASARARTLEIDNVIAKYNFILVSLLNSIYSYSLNLLGLL